MQTELEIRVLSAEEFCARVIPSLSDREAENGLPFGIAQRLAAQPAAAQSALLLAVEAAGEVVAGAVWTPPHDVVVTRLPPGAAALIAERCATSGLHPTGASGPEGSGLELAELLARHTSSAVRVRVRQRVYELTRVEPVPPAAGTARRALATDIELVATWYEQFVREVNLPRAPAARDWATATIDSGSAFLWQDGADRCLACLSRETPNGRAIGPVYTPPQARGRGYATSLVAALSRQVLASGKRFACLFTDADNPTSNHIYESIGFRFVCRYDAHALVPGV
jgi:uncharacterized protein